MVVGLGLPRVGERCCAFAVLESCAGSGGTLREAVLVRVFSGQWERGGTKGL